MLPRFIVLNELNPSNKDRHVKPISLALFLHLWMIVVYNNSLHLIEFTHFRRAKNIMDFYIPLLLWQCPIKPFKWEFSASAGITERLFENLKLDFIIGKELGIKNFSGEKNANN